MKSVYATAIKELSPKIKENLFAGLNSESFDGIRLFKALHSLTDTIEECTKEEECTKCNPPCEPIREGLRLGKRFNLGESDKAILINMLSAVKNGDIWKRLGEMGV